MTQLSCSPLRIAEALKWCVPTVVDVPTIGTHEICLLFPLNQLEKLLQWTGLDLAVRSEFVDQVRKQRGQL